MRKIIPCLAAAAAFTALLPLGAAASARPAPEQVLQHLLAGRTAGTPVDCLPLASISSSRIIDRTGIVFETGPGELYLNTPPRGAEMLDSNDTLVIDTRTSQLCRVDTIGLRSMASGMTEGFVGLGSFVPYRLAHRG